MKKDNHKRSLLINCLLGNRSEAITLKKKINEAKEKRTCFVLPDNVLQYIEGLEFEVNAEGNIILFI